MKRYTFENEYFEGGQIAFQSYNSFENKKKCLREAIGWKCLLNQKKIKEGKLLDFGCAYGYFNEVFDPSFEYFGVDISTSAITEARRRYPSLKDHFICLSDDHRWPFERNFFKVIIFNSVLEHIPNYRAVLREAHECLRSDGLILVEIPSRVHHKLSKYVPIFLKDQDKTHIPSSMPCFWKLDDFFGQGWDVVDIKYDRLKLGKLWKIEKLINKGGFSLKSSMEKAKIFYFNLKIVLTPRTQQNNLSSRKSDTK